MGPTLPMALAQLEAAVVDAVGPTKKLAGFLAFHAANPRVYALVERFALQAHAVRCRLGRPEDVGGYGIGAIWERVRWEVAIETQPGPPADFKLNNNFRALYARLFLLHHPECVGLFELRRLHPEDGAAPMAQQNQ